MQAAKELQAQKKTVKPLEQEEVAATASRSGSGVLRPGLPERQGRVKKAQSRAVCRHERRQSTRPCGRAPSMSSFPWSCAGTPISVATAAKPRSGIGAGRNLSSPTTCRLRPGSATSPCLPGSKASLSWERPSAPAPSSHPISTPLAKATRFSSSASTSLRASNPLARFSSSASTSLRASNPLASPAATTCFACCPRTPPPPPLRRTMRRSSRLPAGRRPWTCVRGGPLCSRLFGFLGRYARRATPCHGRSPSQPAPSLQAAAASAAVLGDSGWDPLGAQAPPPPNLARQPPARPPRLAAPGCANYRSTAASPPSRHLGHSFPRTPRVPKRTPRKLLLAHHAPPPASPGLLTIVLPYPSVPPPPLAPATHGVQMPVPSRSVWTHLAITEQPVPAQAFYAAEGVRSSAQQQPSAGKPAPGSSQHVS